MGKKGKKNKEPEKKSSPVPWIIAAVVVVVVALGISGNLPFTEAEKDTGKSFNLSGKETRPLLDPAMFTGQTRMAYATAAKYSKYLDEVFCYCYCDQAPFRHKSLLSCFATKHGAG